jgi:hypothetical protein
MTPEFYRRQAVRCREIAATQPGTESAAHLMAQADDHETTAVLLIELNKINAALPRPALPRPALPCPALLFTRRRDLH